MELDLAKHSPLGRVVEANWFKNLSFGLILASAAFLGLETSNSIRAEYGVLLHVLERTIVWLFALELMLRILAHGRLWPKFFTSGWNVFDFVVVAFCFMPAVGQFSAVARLARVLRALRLFSFLPNLQLLIEALLRSFASMGYVGLLLSIVFYVYGVLGVGLFGIVDPERFGSLGAAVLTLFQVLTLEAWVEVMAPHRVEYPLGAPLFFVSFILLGTMIVLNLFIGVIVNGMSEAQAEMAKEKAKRERANLDDALRVVEEKLAALRTLIEQTEAGKTAATFSGEYSVSKVSTEPGF